MTSDHWGGSGRAAYFTAIALAGGSSLMATASLVVAGRPLAFGLVLASVGWLVVTSRSERDRLEVTIIAAATLFAPVIGSVFGVVLGRGSWATPFLVLGLAGMVLGVGAAMWSSPPHEEAGVRPIDRLLDAAIVLGMLGAAEAVFEWLGGVPPRLGTLAFFGMALLFSAAWWIAPSLGASRGVRDEGASPR